jgi:multidrug efflux pump subunit AcrA (membrane-fusion protein)
VAGVAVIVLLAGGGVMLSRPRVTAGGASTGESPGGAWVELNRSDFEEVCKEDGELRPTKVTTITFTRWGRLAWLIDDGARVKKGEVVAKLEIEELEKEIQRVQEELADAERNLAQQEQALELERKRFETDLQAERDRRDLAQLTERETLARPKDIEKEEAANVLKEAAARTAAARADHESMAPLIEMGFAQRADLEAKELTLRMAECDEASAKVKAKKILDGATEIERAKAAQGRRKGEIAYQLKEQQGNQTLRDLEAKVAAAKRLAAEHSQHIARHKRELEESVRTAPHDGIIVYRQVGWHDTKKVEVGEWVGPWRSPLDLPNYEIMKVRTQVPESVVGRLLARRGGDSPQPGSPARVRIQTLAGKVYPAEVIWIEGWARDRNADLSEADIKSQGYSGLQVFNVEVELLESDTEHLREGFRAKVEFPVRTLKEVLVLPRHAVTIRAGQATVRVEKDGSPETRPVTLGPESSGRVVITEGLREGERVFVPPAPPQAASEDEVRPRLKGEEETGAPPGGGGMGAGKSEGGGARRGGGMGGAGGGGGGGGGGGRGGGGRKGGP